MKQHRTLSSYTFDFPGISLNFDPRDFLRGKLGVVFLFKDINLGKIYLPFQYLAQICS